MRWYLISAPAPSRSESAIFPGKLAQLRKAAPFAKGAPKPEPKKRGRKPGKDYGTKAHRQAPEQIDETYEAPLPDMKPAATRRCPHGSARRSLEEGALP